MRRLHLDGHDLAEVRGIAEAAELAMTDEKIANSPWLKGYAEGVRDLAATFTGDDDPSPELERLIEGDG